MRSRCPPGVICIENLTIFYIILCVGLVALYFYMNRQTSPNIIIQKENYGIHMWGNSCSIYTVCHPGTFFFVVIFYCFFLEQKHSRGGNQK